MHSLKSLFLSVVLVALTLSCGETKPTPDQFFNAIVDCAKVNPNNAEAGAAVYGCLANAVAGNPAACLSGLLAGGHWTIDEIACLVRELGANANAKKLAGDGSSVDANVAQAARNWITTEKIGYR